MGGRKTFVTNTVLTAADVQDYLMDQSVMVFSDSTTRGSAIPSPTEGMVSYLTGTDSLEAYNGTNWTSAAGVSSGNAIINGAFEINQRNFSSSVDGGFGFDRWTTVRGGAGTVTSSSETFTLGAAPVAGVEAKNFQRIVTSGQSGAGLFTVLFQPIESVRTFAGQTVTFSFYAKSGTGTPKIALELQQNFGTGGSPSAEVNTSLSAVTINTSWTRYSATVSLPSISGKTIGTNNNDSLFLGLWVSAGSDFATRASSIGIQSNTFDIWGVQLEAGSVANPFRRNANSFEGELAACQRYFASLGSGAVGRAYAATNANVFLSFPAVMRATPTLSFGGNFTASEIGVSGRTVTAVSLDGAGTSGASVILTSSGLTSPNMVGIGSTNNLQFNAEL
jgi:hypothetical protein